MAKQRRNHTSVSAITGLLEAIDKVAEVELGNASPEQTAEAKKVGLEAVKNATANLRDSNIITGLECQDEAIEQMHQAEEQAALEAAGVPPIIDAEPAAPAEPAALPEANENNQEPLEP